jgi:hypothetical protein
VPSLRATAEPTSTTAIALETVEDGETVVRDLRPANDPTALSALAGMAGTVGRPVTLNHASVTERHTPRSQFPRERVRPI